MPHSAQIQTEPRQAIAALREQARQAGQRALVVAAGNPAWGRALALDLWDHEPEAMRLWLAEDDGPVERLGAHHARGLLGQERQLLIVDAHNGLSADAFGALSGTLVGGGLLVLLTPPLMQWADMPGANPYATAASRFVGHLLHCLQSDSAPLIIEQPDHLTQSRHEYHPADKRHIEPPCRSNDQRQAVKAIMALADSPSPPPLVITSDRGRGKSAALGIAAAQLLETRAGYRIGVCAPRPAACAALFERAFAMLPDATRGRNRLDYHGGNLRFLAADALLAQRPELDLLLIDEAAALPVPILARITAEYSRLVFASTVHGYEGTGRGFALRFAQVLDKQTSGWQSLTLEQPIRWREYDPLERFVFRALLLDAEPADPEPDLTPDQCRYVELDRDTLIQDSRYLRELFGLLVLAHYRTRPEDLQRLLDDPNLRLFALEHREHPVAVLVLGDEGGFDAALAEEIYLGRRRPQGHLLAQSLAFHSGVPNAARYRYGRVLRIGVHPLLQRRGLGSALLARVIESLETAADLDAVGASFSASAELIPFWQRAGLNPVRLGLTREHTSGQPALLVLKPLSKQGASVYRRARERFEQHWPSLRAGPLRDIDSALAEQLQPSSISRLEKTLTQADIEDIESYVYGQRGYEVCAWPIEKLVSMLLMDTSRNSLLDSENRQLLTRKVIEKQDWSALCTEFNLDGQKAARRQLRDAVVKAWQLWEKA